MRGKACSHTKRPPPFAQVPDFLPLFLAFAGVGGGPHLMMQRLIPVAGAVALVGGVGGVLLASMKRQGGRCEHCGATEPHDENESARLDAEQQAGERERIREELSATLREEVESELRPR